MALEKLSEIANAAADELSVARPSAYVGNVTPGGRLLLSCANSAGRALMRVHEWGSLQKVATITTSNGVDTYALEADYDRMISETGWDRSNQWMMVGPDSPQINRYLNDSGVAQAGIRKRFRLQGPNIIIWPMPTTTETLVYEYVSNKWARDSGGTMQVEFTADTNTTVFDPDLFKEEIKWRYKFSKGMAWEDNKAYADILREQKIASDLGGSTISMAPEPSSQFIELENIPDNNWAI